MSGGNLEIDLAEEAKSPGHKSFGEIVLRGPLTSTRKNLFQWINETARGKDIRKNITVHLLNRQNGRDIILKTYTYNECFLTRYKAGIVSLIKRESSTGPYLGESPITEEVAIKPIRVELK